MISLFEDVTKSGVGGIAPAGARTTTKKQPTRLDAPNIPLMPSGEIEGGTSVVGMYSLDPEQRMQFIKNLQKRKEQPLETTYQAPTSILTGTERMRGAKARGKLLGGKKNANY